MMPLRVFTKIAKWEHAEWERGHNQLVQESMCDGSCSKVKLTDCRQLCPAQIVESSCSQRYQDDIIDTCPPEITDDASIRCT